MDKGNGDEQMSDEELRTAEQIIEAEREYFDRIWYHRSLQREYRLEADGDLNGLESLRRIAASGRARVEEKYAGKIGPYTDFELGMLHGKLSALRWVIGSEWDFLDT